jgi:hypothetical protein
MARSGDAALKTCRLRPWKQRVTFQDLLHIQTGREGDALMQHGKFSMDAVRKKWFWPLIREMASNPGRWIVTEGVQNDRRGLPSRNSNTRRS